MFLDAKAIKRYRDQVSRRSTGPLVAASRAAVDERVRHGRQSASAGHLDERARG